MSSCIRTYCTKCGIIVLGLLLTICIQLSILWYHQFRPDWGQVRKSPDIEHEKDWRPPQIAIDTWENTAPFLHCPRGSNRKAELMNKLKSLVASNTSSFCSCPTEVTFFLVTNMATGVLPVSEQLYQLCGCRYVHIRLNATLWPGWQWIYKVGIIHISIARVPDRTTKIVIEINDPVINVLITTTKPITID